MTLSITVPGKPVGKQRPRMTKTGHVYTPAKTENYEAVVRSLWIAEHGNCKPSAMPTRLFVVVNMSVPKSATKKQRERMLSNKERPTKKPDLDNVLKIISDALNGLAYEDDKQIVSMEAVKRYADHDSVDVCVSPYVYKPWDQTKSDGGMK